MTKLRQRSAKVDGRGRFADTTLLVSDRDDFHLEMGMAVPAVPDDVAARSKRKLNFSDFRFRIFEVDLAVLGNLRARRRESVPWWTASTPSL